MKLKGRTATHNVITIVFPREGQDPLVFKAGAILDSSEFEKLMPEPVAPMVRKAGETTDAPDFNAPVYVKQVQRRSELQTYWMIIKSLEATEDLVWEKVKTNDPTTWKALDVELKEFGLSNIEKAKLIQAVMRANSLDEAFIEAAKQRFIASQQAQATMVTSSQVDVNLNTKSGEPVKS